MPIGSRSRRSRIGSIGAAPPPAPPPPGQFDEFDDSAPTRRKRRRKDYDERPPVVPFTARLHVAELDERRRPGPTWTAKACELGRSRIVLRSRRMCYRGRQLLMAVHLVDDKPMVLYGIVDDCTYDCEGMHRIDIDLEHLPTDAPAIKSWVDDL